MGEEKDDTKESNDIYDSAQAAATVCRQASECGDELAKSLESVCPPPPRVAPFFILLPNKTLLFFFRIVLVILGLWVFNINDRIRLSISKKKSTGIFLGIAICKECIS